MAENCGNANVFLRPTNRKHFPLPGQFGLAASDYMYGNQRPEFYQCMCMCTIFSLDGSGSDLAEWFIERLTANAEVATVLFQHPPTQWNLRGGR
jgi:hypothetical protein